MMWKCNPSEALRLRVIWAVAGIWAGHCWAEPKFAVPGHFEPWGRSGHDTEHSRNQ